LEITTMNRQSSLPLFALAFALLVLAAWNFSGRPAGRAAQPAANPSSDSDAVAQQIKDLQQRTAELQSQVKELRLPRIISAGTVTIHLGPQQDNKTKIRVKLPADVVAQLGGNCIVELTNRYPTGDTFFIAYWRPATDGFDILLADPTLQGGVQLNPDRTAPYYVDWIVVRK
jgi:hypothetical protein